MIAYRNKISWSGVFAGLLVGLIVFIASLNVGALLTALLPLDLTGTGIMALIWTLISVIAAAFVAGAVSMFTQTPDAKVYSVESTDEDIEAVTHRFRYDAKINGLVTGALILLSTTYFAVSGLTALVTGASKAALATTVTATATTAGATAGVASIDEVRAYFANVSENDVRRFVDENIPGLSGQQAFAVTNAIRSEADRVANYVQAAPLDDLPETLKKGYVDLKNSLTGTLFRDKLMAEGLTLEQANDILVKTEQFVNEMQAKVQQAIDKTVEYIKNTTIVSTITWLITAALILGASVLGAMSMSHTTSSQELRKTSSPNSKKVRI